MVNFVYSRQQKMKTIFYLRDDNGKLWVEVTISNFLNAVATLDVFPGTNTDINLAVKTNCRIKD